MLSRSEQYGCLSKLPAYAQIRVVEGRFAVMCAYVIAARLIASVAAASWTCKAPRK